MEGPVASGNSKKSTQDASSSSKGLKKPPIRRLLRRLSSNAGSEASALTETKACTADDSQVRSIVSLPEVSMMFVIRILSRRSVNPASQSLYWASWASYSPPHPTSMIKKVFGARNCFSVVSLKTRNNEMSVRPDALYSVVANLSFYSANLLDATPIVNKFSPVSRHISANLTNTENRTSSSPSPARSLSLFALWSFSATKDRIRSMQASYVRCLLPALIPTPTSLQEQMLQKTKQHQQGRPRSQSYSIYLSLSQELDGSPSVRRFTPPLSPSQRSVKQVQNNDEENRVSAAASIAMLKRPGVPALGDITKLKKTVGAAPRAWVLDFKIRGGRWHTFPCFLLSAFIVCHFLDTKK